MEDPAEADDWWSEDEYVETLELERRRFAWVVQRYGGKTPAEAEAEAVEFYCYQGPGTPCRGLVFHDDAWHWAMLGIHGLYWNTRPELARPSDEYYDVE
ncbi:hypothetical protein [Nocardia lijiangensis]|uniref:hypothetical protein n=1 Tax=Nocardia lijiangensis TaxID=299618 RepID=UPI003D728F8B